MLVPLFCSDQSKGQGREESRSGAHRCGGREGGDQVFSGQHSQDDADTLLLILLPVS